MIRCVCAKDVMLMLMTVILIVVYVAITPVALAGVARLCLCSTRLPQRDSRCHIPCHTCIAFAMPGNGTVVVGA